MSLESQTGSESKIHQNAYIEYTFNTKNTKYDQQPFFQKHGFIWNLCMFVRVVNGIDTIGTYVKKLQL